MKGMKLAWVNLEAINLEEKKFCLSPIIDFKNLVLSIAQIGLIVPPRVKPSDKGLILVSGWRRLLACRELKYQSIPVLMTVEDAADLDLLIQAIEENLTTRSLSLAEKAEAICKLHQYGLDQDKIMADFLPRFALPPRKDYVQLLVRVATQGDENLKIFLHQKEISLDALDVLLTFSPEVQRKLIPLLQTLTYSQRRQIIFFLHEIAVRDKISIEMLIEEELKGIAEEAQFSWRAKAEIFLEKVRQKRFPLITAWEKQMRQTLKELSWPEEIQLTYDPTFERPELKIAFAFRDPVQFISLLDKLRKISDQPAFLKLFRRSFEE